ncbi:MAG: hypothetical protein EP348_05195 [Alphaproteobacteria bacterium]|nr:MAG: hypothetical protein EP348_05195 [Alphaproteobacteria bacterium]
MAENEQLRAKNKRLSEAVLALVDKIETNLPALQQTEGVFSSQRAAGYDEAVTKTKKKRKKTKKKAREKAERMKFTPPPTMEVFETYKEPIEFAEPAPQMTFGRHTPQGSRRYRADMMPEVDSEPTEYFISPDLEPDEIDLLKSPTRTRLQEKPDVVDLHPSRTEEFPPSQARETERFEAKEMADEAPEDIPDFEFPDEEPVVDVEYERKETLRAAMRRRVNRLRW